MGREAQRQKKIEAREMETGHNGEREGKEDGEKEQRQREVETLRKEMKKIRTGERHNGIFLRGPGKRL